MPPVDNDHAKFPSNQDLVDLRGIATEELRDSRYPRHVRQKAMGVASGEVDVPIERLREPGLGLILRGGLMAEEHFEIEAVGERPETTAPGTESGGWSPLRPVRPHASRSSLAPARQFQQPTRRRLPDQPGERPRNIGVSDSRPGLELTSAPERISKHSGLAGQEGPGNVVVQPR